MQIIETGKYYRTKQFGIVKVIATGDYAGTGGGVCPSYCLKHSQFQRCACYKDASCWLPKTGRTVCWNNPEQRYVGGYVCVDRNYIIRHTFVPVSILEGMVTVGE